MGEMNQEIRNAGIEQLLDAVAWRKIEYQTDPSLVSDTLPHVTHEGTLDICGVTFRVYQLSNRMRIIDADDLKEFFGVI
jgi:hypothetical protein